MRIITKAVLAVSMAVMCAGTAHAQEKGSSRSYDWEGTHEITFKAGLHSWELGLHIHNNSHSVSYHDSKTVYTPSFALEYGFNTEKWMSVGMGVYYGMARTRLLDASGELLKTEDIHDLSVMINIRFYWLNRPLIRMYSGIGTGCSISMHREDDAQLGYIGPDYIGWGYDIRLIGLTVGKKLYGNFEAGVFPHGYITAGLGYRF